MESVDVAIFTFSNYFRMKKFTIFIFAFLWISVFTVQADIKIGVKAGANLAKASFNVEAIQPKNYTGFQVGPILEVNLPVLPISLDAAILYSQNGLKIKGLTFEEKMSTLDVPVNLKLKIHLLNNFGPYLTAGPYVSVKLNDEQTFENLKIDVNRKNFRAGVNLGGGIELSRHLQVGVNYQICLNDEYKVFDVSDYWGNLKDLKAKSRIWSITAAYFF